MKLTKERIFRGLNCGAPNYKQLRAIGAKVPPVKGWIRELVGKEVTEQQYYEFCSLRIRKNPVNEQKKKKDPFGKARPGSLSFDDACAFANSRYGKYPEDFS